MGEGSFKTHGRRFQFIFSVRKFKNGENLDFLVRHWLIRKESQSQTPSEYKFHEIIEVNIGLYVCF